MIKYKDPEIFKLSDKMFILIQELVDKRVFDSKAELINEYNERKDDYERLFEEALKLINSGSQSSFSRKYYLSKSPLITFYSQIGYQKSSNSFWTDTEMPKQSIKEWNNYKERGKFIMYDTLKKCLIHNQTYINKHHKPWDFLPS